MKKRTMKKMGSFILACLMVVSTFATLSTVAYAESNSYKTKINETFDTLDSEELAALTADPTTYDISVFIEFESSAEELVALMSDGSIHEIGKSYHSNKNQKLAQTLELGNAYISKYAPFAEIRYDSMEEYEDSWKEIRRIAKSDAVRDIDVSFSEKDCGNVWSTGQSANAYSISEALSDVGITTNSYNGESVMVGVLEQGIPDDTSHIPSGQYYSFGETESVHATDVTSILLEVASDITLVCVATDDYSFLEAIELLMDEGVKLMNVSASFLEVQYYDNRSAYVDYITYLYQCLFVVAAGDDTENLHLAIAEGLTDPYIESPGLSVNCLTVGAMNTDGQVWYRSAYETSSGPLYKVDMVAPGENLTWAHLPSYQLSGTSFAAPFVTGIAARLLDEFSFLANNTHVLRAAMIQSCEKVPNQTSEYDYCAGAGLVNYTNARQIISNGNYLYATKPVTLREDGYLTWKAITIPANSTMHLYLNSLIPGTYSSNPNTGTADFSITRYKLDFQVDGESVFDFCNYREYYPTYKPYIAVSNTSSQAITYGLVLSVLEDGYPDDYEYVAIAYDFTSNS